MGVGFHLTYLEHAGSGAGFANKDPFRVLRLGASILTLEEQWTDRFARS